MSLAYLAVLMMRLLLLFRERNGPSQTSGFRRSFERLSQEYFPDHYFAFIRAPALHYSKDLARLRPSLEVGCGNGFFSSLVFDESRLTVASDILWENVKGASQRHFSERLAVLDTKAIPFHDNSFSVIFAHHIMNRIYDTTSAVREVRRCLAPGGYFAMSDIGPSWLFGDCQTLLFKLIPIRSLRESLTKKRLVRGYNVVDTRPAAFWKGELERNGFEVMSVKFYCSLWPFILSRVLFTIAFGYSGGGFFSLLCSRSSTVRDIVRDVHMSFFCPVALNETYKANDETCAAFFIVARTKGELAQSDRIPPYACPQCKTTLQSKLSSYWCQQCRTEYPLFLGIPVLLPDLEHLETEVGIITRIRQHLNGN